MFILMNFCFVLGNETDPNDTLNTSDEKSPPGKRKVIIPAIVSDVSTCETTLLLETFLLLLSRVHFSLNKFEFESKVSFFLIISVK